MPMLGGNSGLWVWRDGWAPERLQVPCVFGRLGIIELSGEKAYSNKYSGTEPSYPEPSSGQQRQCKTSLATPKTSLELAVLVESEPRCRAPGGSEHHPP